jgi:predicted nucleotidyltransferase
MKPEIKSKILAECQKYPEVKLVYLFGSQVNGSPGPNSDYDIAIYIDHPDALVVDNVFLTLAARLPGVIGTPQVDLVPLHASPFRQPVLFHEIISRGEVLLEVEPFRVIVVSNILNAYYDYKLQKQKARDGYDGRFEV